MPEISFEQNFAKLADNELNSKVPALMQYRIGFQLLDKNDDETEAVGITAFIVNSVWLYMPIIFIKGKIKGTDLLWVKQYSMMVPARDNWITMFKSQGREGLGTIVDMKETVLGASPAQVSLLKSPKLLSKMASENSLITPQEWEQMINCNKVATFEFNLIEKVAEAGSTVSSVFVNTVTKSPDFANTLFTHYTVSDMEKLAELISQTEKKKASTSENDSTKVTFITSPTEDAAKKLKDGDKRILVQNGVFIDDKRMNFSKIFNATVNTQTVQNPTTSGVYDVLLIDGTYKPMAVVFVENMNNDEKKGERLGKYQRLHGKNYPSTEVALIDFDKNGFYRKKASEIYTRPLELEKVKEQLKKAGGKSASVSSIVSAFKKTGKEYLHSVILTQGLSRSFHIINRHPVSVKDETVCIGDTVIEFTGEEGKLSKHVNCIYVPKDVRMFEEIDTYSQENKLALGNLSNIYNKLVKEASLEPLTIHASANTAEIRRGVKSTGLLQKTAALKHLVLDLGIYAGQAQQLIKEAAAAPSKRVEYFIKLAAPYDTESYMEAKQPFMGGPASRREEGVIETIDTKQPDKSRRMMPQDAITKATEASKTGIKEVFDVQALASLLEVADISEIRRNYIVDIMKGMDRVGRMLMLMYWHGKEFEERYGEEDMNQLEDSLKQVFIKLGDLVLFLKEKKAMNADETENLMGELSEDISKGDKEQTENESSS